MRLELSVISPEDVGEHNVTSSRCTQREGSKSIAAMTMGNRRASRSMSALAPIAARMLHRCDWSPCTNNGSRRDYSVTLSARASVDAQRATRGWPFKLAALEITVLRRASPVASCSADPDADHAEFMPARLAAEAGLPTRASASVTVSTVAGMAMVDATAKPRSLKTPRRETNSAFSVSLMVNSRSSTLVKLSTAN